MTDEHAVKLGQLLACYANACLREGMAVDEVAALTVGDVIVDIVDTTPSYMANQLDTVTVHALYDAA